MELERLQIIIQGQVQGVGFRPCVYRVAKELGLTGWIQNNTSGVLIEIQGSLVSNFVRQLKVNLPPLAKVNNIQLKTIPVKINEALFAIIQSEKRRV